MWTRQLLVAFGALALAGAASAQTPPMSPSAPDSRGATSTPSRNSDTAAPSSRSDSTNPSPGAAAGASAKFLTMQKDNERLSSDLIGMPVSNSAGENVGRISGLLIDKDHKLTGAVLSVGGFLGLGSKSVAVPWESLKIESRDNRQVAVLSMSNDEIVNAPDFKTQAQMKAETEAPRTRAPGTATSPVTPRGSQ